MRFRLIPTLAVCFYLAMVFFVTYPGYVPFNHIRPFVFGLPFSLFWQVIWITSSIFVLTGVFLWEKRRAAQASGPRDERSASSSEARE
jgi:uncharacterized membrane protein